MKKKSLIVAAVTMAVLFLIAFGSPATAKEFVLGTLADVEAPLVKVRVAFMQEVFKANGYDLTVKTLPALRSLEAANKGETDGDLLRAYKMDTKPYPNLVMVDCPASYYPLFAFVTNPDLKIQGIKSLASYRVITMRGDRIMEGKINPAIPKDKLTVVASYEQAFKMLAAGRADVVVSDRSKAFYFTKKLGIEDKITMVKRPLILVNLYTYLNKKHAALAGDIAATMQAKMDDGTYQKMIGVPPPKPDK